MGIQKQTEYYFEKVADRLKDQDIAGAINLLSKILELDPKNNKASTEKLLLEEIVKFNNTNIFSSTNLFMDPWE